MKWIQSAGDHQTLIIITPQFDELAIISMSCSLRQLGLSVGLVGTTLKGVPGLHGIRICPDFNLDWLQGSISIKQQTPSILICSLPDEHSANYLSHPSLFRLVSATLHGGGILALINETLPAFIDKSRVMRQFDLQQIWVQGARSHSDFSRELVDFLDTPAYARLKLKPDEKQYDMY